MSKPQASSARASTLAPGSISGARAVKACGLAIVPDNRNIRANKLISVESSLSIIFDDLREVKLFFDPQISVPGNHPG